MLSSMRRESVGGRDGLSRLRNARALCGRNARVHERDVCSGAAKTRENVVVAAVCFAGLFVLMLLVAGVGSAVGWKGRKVAEWVVSVLWCSSGFLLVALLKEREK